ncbi:serine hydrolase domain-containing protein [Microbacterium sp. YY-03]|uniref:serine hydrolase domain-containing protein n=1 Tax=Microbacterium sp. YY-03 TaxID=3421636 RepID=UPI003D1824C9
MTRTDDAVVAVLPRLEPFLREWIDTQRVMSGVPAVQVAVRLGKDVLFSYASGVTDTATREPVTTQHAFRIASHSKTFTATLIMQLVERGELSLDATVGSLIPELADAPVASRTVRALLGHQAGVERDGVDANWWQRTKLFPNRNELIAELQHDSVYPANTHFHYSNLAYSLLGLIIEAATKRDFNDVALDVVPVLSEFMGAPATLGPDLGAGADVEIVSGHAAPLGYWRDGDAETVSPVVAPVDTRAQASATGFWANAETISAWLSAHALGTDLFLNDDSKRLMQRKESTITKNGLTRFYGLGWIQRAIGKRHVIGHSGGFPGHITQTWGDPKTGLAVSVLTNRIDGKASDWATAIIRLLDEAAHEVARAESDDVSDVNGTFWALWGATAVVALPGVALQLSPAAVDPAGVMTIMHPDDDGALRSVPEDGFADAGEVMRVERDEAGVASITVTGITSWREGLYAANRDGLLNGAL